MPSQAADDEAMREDAALVERAFDQMPVMMMALAGPELRIAAVNEASRDFLGRGRTLIGRPARQVLPDIAGQQIFEMLERVYATGRAQAGRDWRVQLAPDQAGPREVYVDFTIVPWRDPDGRVAGVLSAWTDSTEQALARRAAQHQADEAERRYLAARDVVAELQEALLPTSLPVLPRARIAARYLVAGQDQSAGGDWFDALPQADGSVVLIVGDVVGHGVAASAAMGQLRAVLDELLAAGTGLPAVLARADGFAARVPALRGVTLAVAVLRPEDGRITYTTCGHPPPLIISPAGTGRFLPGTGTGPLGTGSAPVLATAQLQPGELILLYSDGLVERPHRTLPEGMAELAAVASDAAANRALPAGAAAAAADRVCQLTVELLTRSGYTDDVTTLAAERLAETVPALQLQGTAELAMLRVIRDRFDDWLARVGPDRDDRDALRLAVVELVTNAIEHAYRDAPPGPVQLHATLCDDGYLECEVSDEGTWRAPDQAAPYCGNGLMVARHMVEELTVRQHPGGGGGTVVALRHRLRRPAVLAPVTGGPAAAAGPPEPLALDLQTGGPVPVVTVRGAVDATTADQLAQRLLAACRGGTIPLTVDLGPVSQLASAGVRALYQVREQLARHQQPLVLLAPPRSTAHAVLALVGLLPSAA